MAGEPSQICPYGNIAEGTTVKLWENTGYDVQIWVVHPNSNGSYSFLYSGNQQYCFGFVGQNAVLQKRNPHDPMQEWILEDISHKIPKEYFSLMGKNNVITLQLPPDITCVISLPLLQKWANRLEIAYSSFQELTGYVPYTHVIIEGYKTGSHSNYAGWVFPNSNVIHIDSGFLRKSLEVMSMRGADWNFCTLHEMSHLFDFDMPWTFEAELLADLKLAYVLERNHAAVALLEFPGAPYFYGSDIAKAYAARGKDFSVRYDIFGCAKRFLDMKEAIGWEPFLHTFRHLYEKRSRYAGISPEDKFSLFLNTLSLFSGRNIKSFFSADEWLAILREIHRDP